MVYAFVLVKTGAGVSAGVLDRLADIDGIVEAHIVAGEYDIIAEVEVAEVHGVLEVVSDGVQSLEGVLDTKTYIALE